MAHNSRKQQITNIVAAVIVILAVATGIYAAAPLHKGHEAIYLTCTVITAALLTLLGLYLLNHRLQALMDHRPQNLQDELKARSEAEYELHIQAKLLEDEIAVRQKAEEELHLAKKLAESVNQAKSFFLTNMSHELRTPLNGVIGMAQLLALTGMTEEQQDLLETLQLSANSLLGLINNILDITRIETEQLQISEQEYSLRACIKETVMLQQPHLAEKGLWFKLQLPDDVPDILTGDRVRISQILANLLSNAIKFTDQGGITITACIKEQYGAPLLLDLAVTDTGIGIEQEKQAYIFDLFTQADETLTRRHGGIGIGLALSSKLAELIGGTITVESEVNKGSTFHLLLPCTQAS